MWLVAIGSVLVLVKLAGWGMIGLWSWWSVLSPFALAVLWWAFSDFSGLTKRRQAEKEDSRIRQRRQRHLEALGLDSPRRGSKAKRPSVEPGPPAP